jgi:hypothetical protein
MYYLKIADNEVIYPYTIQQLREDNPNTSFPMTVYLEFNTLKDFNVFPVEPTNHPEHDVVYTKVLESVPTQIDGVWTQNWSTVPCTEEEVAQNIETAKTNLQAAVQNRLDSFAQTRNYNGILSCCSYATSTNQKFQQEAQYCVQARDAHWAACYVVLQEFEAGTRSIPTVEELLSLMPTLQWPN